MSLTSLQLQTLGAYIATVPEWNALPNDSDAAFFIAGELDKPASPAFTVWRTSVRQDEITQNGFDWVRVDNLSVGKARIWEWMFGNTARSFNPTKDNVRAGIAECWKGTAADLAVQAAVLAHCKRSANGYEKVFAAGTGTVQAPAVLGVDSDGLYIEGAVSYSTVQQARSL